MRPITQEKRLWFDFFIVISVLASIGITIIAISKGIYEVFPYFYLIPVVLIAYSRPRISIFVTVFVGWLYVGLVYALGLPDTRIFTHATIRFFIFVSIGVLISTYSREYRKEGERSCGTFFNSQAGAFSFDKKTFKIIDPNRKFAQIVKYDFDLLPHKYLSDIITDQEERDIFLSEVENQLRAGDIEVMFTCSDDTKRWMLLTAAECGDQTIMCTFVDITEQKQAQNSLSAANRKLNLLNSITRHDILNQLTALIGYIQLSKQHNNDPQIDNFLFKQEQAADAIRNQILFTRDYQNIGVHFPQWQNVAETVSLAVAALDLTAVIVDDSDLPSLEIYADPLFEKVFYNLLENSVRHGENVNKIVITSNETDEGLDIIIGDDGVGIPDEQKEKIFNREYYKNTGFGLFLSREILAITNLEISETGIYKEGARFVIHAPQGTYRFLSGN